VWSPCQEAMLSDSCAVSKQFSSSSTKRKDQLAQIRAKDSKKMEVCCGCIPNRLPSQIPKLLRPNTDTVDKNVIKANMLYNFEYRKVRLRKGSSSPVVYATIITRTAYAYSYS
ncbi:hypothetical protein Tco_1331552, partial [Tanacetum coccineum]